MNQKILLHSLLLKEKQKELLSISTKIKLIECIVAAILGKKTLFIDANKNINKDLEYIINLIDLNENIFIKNNIIYKKENDILHFNTGGSIEFK